ncbi:AraC family transcriptional regulator [Sphingosinicella sp. BN140058]|uniref:AraC family transcriptional regulator n=1 Tax=Sphingosinicella sp. BN140058 TaxID=1892855 RepID=UPI001010497E|nr:AraC family transcriptional regulator [Sphingosinicella sp. BN140058]QAY75602.1 AraC family transcriptional regulator [Sphingosinicella sp. BN140058]
MDPLSQVVTLLRPAAAVSKPIEGRGQWGVRYEAYDAPGYTIVLGGVAWVSFEGKAPLRIAEGDFLLLPTTPAFSLSSAPGNACRRVEPGGEAVRHGDQGGEPDFVALGGSFSYERANSALLLGLLPELIHIPSSEGRGTRLGRLIASLSEECASDYPGKQLIMQRLLEVLLVEALRWSGFHDHAPPGLLGGMHDPALARVLSAMHSDVGAKWTIAGLAAIAGMSRSAFSARFTEKVGCGPYAYLAAWRMALAKDALAKGTKTLERIAYEVGFESASAFSTAFRKRFGCSPGSFAREPRT